MNHNIIFRLLVRDDINQLHDWLQLPHVRQFWDDGDRTVSQVESHYFNDNHTNRYIFYINNQVSGYIQSYAINEAHEYAKEVTQHDETIGVDYFIGNSEFLGRGMAIDILSQFISSYCQTANRMIVDPEVNNLKAIHIYEKYGFKTINKLIVNDKAHQLMAINIRMTSRAILLNSSNKILLLHMNSKPLQVNSLSSPDKFWVTVGGEIEKNESVESALQREIREEVGITTQIHPELIAFGEQILPWNGFPTRFIEKFFLVRIDDIDLSKQNLTHEEVAVIHDYRWWSINDLFNTKEVIFPGCLARLVNDYINHSALWSAQEISLD